MADQNGITRRKLSSGRQIDMTDVEYNEYIDTGAITLHDAIVSDADSESSEVSYNISVGGSSSSHNDDALNRLTIQQRTNSTEDAPPNSNEISVNLVTNSRRNERHRADTSTNTINLNMLRLFEMARIIFRYTKDSMTGEESRDYLNRMERFQLMVARGVRPENIFMTYDNEIYTLNSLCEHLRHINL